MSEAEDDKRKRHWLAVQNELSPGETEVERTLDNLAALKAGWHRVRAEDGTWLVLPDVPNHPQGSPEQLALENQWEERALAMHDAQEPIRLEPKPQENTLAKRVVRGD